MFDSEYVFWGPHAKKVIALHNEAGVMGRNIDIYMISSLIGFAYGRRSPLCKDCAEGESTVVNTKIFHEQLYNCKEKLELNYRMILLLDEEYEPDEQKRIDKAFRYFGKNEADIERCEDYSRGGIEVLYEKIIGDALRKEDYANNLFDFIDEFNYRFNKEIDISTVMKLLSK